MADVQHGGAALDDIVDLVLTLALEARVTDGQRLVDNEDVGVNVDVDRKAQTHFHTAGVGADRLIDIVAQLREIDDSLLDLADVGVLQAEDVAFEVNVLAAGHLGGEARGQLEQRRDLTLDLDLALAGEGNAGDHLEDGGFTRAVIADDTDTFAALDVEGDVLERFVDLGVAGLEEQGAKTLLIVFI